MPANRDAQCKALDYDLGSMPQTTVVFVFCNEALSTLLRSIHSVLNRSPPQLLKEIVLIDDFSDLQTRPELGAQLEEYIKLLPAKVRLYRQPARLGLVEARLRGVEEATAETFTILDSHIEAQTGWLEPLMQQIGESPHSVVMPMIDSTDSATFTPRRGGIGCSLGFLWSLIEHVIPLQHQEQVRRDSAVDSIRSPTMAGGLFSARKDYFMHLGGYDRKWGFWGTENIEFSFRIWQCGGLLECMPCSRVYHVFRHGGSAYDMPGTHLAKNKLRTAAIWMDEFAPVVEYGLGFTPERKAEMVEVREDISEMVALRERLQVRIPREDYFDANDLIVSAIFWAIVSCIFEEVLWCVCSGVLWCVHGCSLCPNPLLDHAFGSASRSVGFLKTCIPNRKSGRCKILITSAPCSSILGKKEARPRLSQQLACRCALTRCTMAEIKPSERIPATAWAGRRYGLDHLVGACRRSNGAVTPAIYYSHMVQYAQ